MRIPRYTLLVLALTALLALLAGCGGGGGDSTESTVSTTTEAAPVLSKAELIAQGDAICAEVNAAVGSLAGSESTSGEGTQVPSLYVGMIEDIEELGTPGETTGYPEFSEAAEDLAKVEGEVKLAVEREDSVALSEAETEAAAALSQFQTRAEAYGFEKCSEGPSAPTANPGGVTPGEEGEAVEEGGVEAEEPEYAEPEYVEPEAEEPAPETGGAGGGEEPAPEGGGTGAGGGEGAESGGSSGGVGPG